MRFILRFLYLLGYPIYFILETIIVFALVIFYQAGQLVLQRIPFLAKFFALGAKLIFIRSKLYLFKYTKKKLKLPELPRRRKLIALGIAAIGIFLFSFWLLILRDLPSPQDLVRHPRPLTTHILDRNGKLLFKIYRTQNRTVLPLTEIPLHIQQATIAIEDAEFYSHPGFSLRGMARAITRNLAKGEFVGGSTITQQLVKNALLTREKTFRRKAKEIILSVMAEIKFSKKEILTMYLNEVSYGGAAYGIEEAAQNYFGKSARDLSLSEAALLAGLPAAPTRFSPYGANPTLAKVRQKLVLSRMVEEGFITPEQAEEAAKVELSFALQKQEIKAPHFVMYVKQLLSERYGEQLVEEGGLTVVTTLDFDIQDKAETIVRAEVEKLRPLRVGNGAAIVTNPGTGEVLAMVGSRDYFKEGWGNFNVTTALRQPGSAIKPVNYSYALSNGITPATMILDEPVSYNIPGQPTYTPRNYDNIFRGNIPMRVALGSSLNVPAVKTLASYGVDKMIEQGKLLGITTWNDPTRFGLSLTLGGGEVKMVDMAIVYGTFANYGRKVPLEPILKVKDSSGKVLEENGCNKEFQISNFKFQISKIYAAVASEGSSCEVKQVIDPRVAFLLTDILHDNSARTSVFGPNSLLVIPGHPEVAVKTGTTQNLRDNWAIGYTKDYVVAAWVGNNDNTEMSYVASGITGATPIWHRIIRYLLEGKPNEDWQVPQGLTKLAICPITGTLPCEGCPLREEYFLEENQPKSHCVLIPSPSPTPDKE